jgi:hypothetical protein
MYTRTRGCTALVLAVLASVFLIVSQADAANHTNRHGCGVLVDAAHPWHSYTPDAPVETGDHWIVARRGPGSSCAVTRRMIPKLLALPIKTYEGHRDDVTHLLGGICTWETGSRTEHIRPFQHILCQLPVHVHRRALVVDVEAFVDPDPRFIH